MLAPMRRPQRWFVVGVVLAVFGALPILPGAGRIAVFAVGVVIAAVAVARLQSRRTNATDYDRGPTSGGSGGGA
jgi:membrane protein implicated in regulation of membrane protease activity